MPYARDTHTHKSTSVVLKHTCRDTRTHMAVVLMHMPHVQYARDTHNHDHMSVVLMHMLAHLPLICSYVGADAHARPPPAHVLVTYTYSYVGGEDAHARPHPS